MLWLLTSAYNYLLSLMYHNNSFSYLLQSVGLAGICVVVIIFYNKYKYSNIGIVPQHGSTQQFCEHPSCFRCSKNIALKENAKEIFLSDINDKTGIRRLHNAIIGENSDDDITVPHGGGVYLLYVPSLTSRSVWSLEDLPQSYRSDYHFLLGNIHIFIRDFHQIPTFMESNGWSKFFLTNQGQLYKENHSFCYGTSSVLDKCSNIMTGCIFGYIFFSVLHPDSFIAEHNGPTNCRIRCHVSLKVPRGVEVCEMDVAGRKVEWKDKGVVFFDDSLKHSVKYISNQQDQQNRVLLLIDFWHPDLTLLERKCIQRCYGT